MPTVRVVFLEAWSGTLAGLGERLVIATEATLQDVLAELREVREAIDPDLQGLAGSATVAASGSSELVSRTAAAGDRVKGFIASSDGLVRFELTAPGKPTVVARCEIASPAEPVLLPGSFVVAAGEAVKVTAYNESADGQALEASAVLLWRPASA